MEPKKAMELENSNAEEIVKEDHFTKGKHCNFT